MRQCSRVSRWTEERGVAVTHGAGDGKEGWCRTHGMMRNSLGDILQVESDISATGRPFLRAHCPTSQSHEVRKRP